MNSFIDSFNEVGANFTGFAFAMLVQSSLVIVALFLLDLLLRKKVRAVVRYPLWMLLLVKLVLPPSFAAPTSLAYWLPARKMVKPSPVATTPVVVHYSEARYVEPPAAETPSPPRPRLQIAAMLLLAWLAIALGLVAWLVRRSHSVALAAARAAPASNSPEQLLEACRQQMGIKQRVRLKLSANAGSPAVCGLWRPVILIPQALAEKLTPLQLRAVLFHELAHIQRGDVWVNYAQTLLQIFYWWHPLLWFANAQMRRVREQAVDERVMVEMGREAEAYPATLLEVAMLAARRPRTALGLIGIVESKSALSQRIRHLLDRPAPRSAKLGFARLAVVALVGTALLPMARGQRRAQPNPGVNAPAAIVSIEVRYVELTDPALEAISLGNPTVTGPNGHRAWVLPPADDLIERMQGQAGTSIVFAPTVTTHSGQQAQIRVTEPQVINGNVIDAGPVCDLLPEVSGDWIDLTVLAKVTEFGEIVSDQLNGLQLRPRQSDGSGRPEESAVHSVNATGYIIHEAGTARVSVVDAGYVVLQNPEVKSINGKRILVVASPRIVRETASASIPAPNSVSLTGSSSSAARPREEAKKLPTPTTGSTQAQPAGPAPKDNASERIPENVTVTIARGEPYFYFSYLTLDTKPVSLEKLQTEFKRAASLNPAVTLSIRVDKDAPHGLIMKVMDAAKEAGISMSTGPLETNAPSVLETNPREPSGKPSPSEAQSDINQLGFDWFLGNTLMSNGRTGFLGGTAPSFGGAPSLANPVGIFPSPTSPLGAAVTSNSVPALGDLPLLGRMFRSQSALASPGRKAIQAKLNRIVLPEIGFDGVSLPEALQWLVKEAGDRDSEGAGVVFLVNPYVIGPAPQTAVDPNTGEQVTLPPPEPLDMNDVIVRINPPLKNVRLADALEAIVKVADKPIRYWVEGEAVVFARQPGETAQLETRIFKVDPWTFMEYLGKRFPDRATNDVPGLIKNFFTASGVNVLPPNTIYYKDRLGVLMVRATEEELDRVQKAVESLNALKPTASWNYNPGSYLQLGVRHQRNQTDVVQGTQFATPVQDQSPAAASGPGNELNAPKATEELVVAITAQYIYLGSQPVTLEGLKTKLIEAKSRNPNLYLVVKGDRDAPLDQLAGVFAIARALNIEPFSTKPSETIQLETRVFRVSPATLLEGLKNTSGLPPNPGTIDSIQDSIRSFFTATGVNVYPPNALFYNDRTGALMVRATSTELDIVQKALEVLNYRPSQITIEARFIEMPTETAGKLGLDLPPPDDRTSNTWTRILTAAQTRVLLQRRDMDILSAPKITTLSGRQAQFQVVESRTVVTGIDPKALAPPGVQSTHGNSTYLTSQVNCGPTLDVVATVDGNGYTIRLAAQPQLTELTKFRRDEGAPNGANETRVWVDGQQRNVPMPVTAIRTRQMQASVDVYDGQTLVLGSPSVTMVLQQLNGQSISNAIPEDHRKRLLVFITPTIIDPAGSPVHTPGKEPFPADRPPPQQVP